MVTVHVHLAVRRGVLSSHDEAIRSVPECREAWSAIEHCSSTAREPALPSPARPVKARSTTPARSLPNVVQRFVETEASSGVVLIIVTLVALVWANSRWSHGYESLW